MVKGRKWTILILVASIIASCFFIGYIYVMHKESNNDLMIGGFSKQRIGRSLDGYDLYQVYNDIGWPSDGSSLDVIKLKKGLSDDFFDSLVGNRIEKDGEERLVVSFKKANWNEVNEVIKSIVPSDKDKLQKGIDRYFKNDGNHAYYIRNVARTGDKDLKDLDYDQYFKNTVYDRYIICYDKGAKSVTILTNLT